jgi:hypothetical protein
VTPTLQVIILCGRKIIRLPQKKMYKQAYLGTYASLQKHLQMLVWLLLHLYALSKEKGVCICTKRAGVQPKAVGTATLVGFEVVTAVVMKSTLFWDITPYSPLKVSHCFRGTYCLHLQG